MARRRASLAARPPKPVNLKLKMHEGQAKFWAALDSGKRYVAAVTGIRGGKSFIGARRALFEAVKRGGLGWIVAPTYNLAKVPARFFDDLVNQTPGLVADHRDHPFPYWRLATPKAPEIEVRSADHPDHLRGPALSWVWIDEAALVDYEAWRILVGRVLDTGGVVFITTTPRGKNWVYDEFMVNPSLQHAIFTWRTTDNIFLPKDRVEELIVRWGQGTNYARQELEGEFVSFEGLVYSDFDAEFHVKESPELNEFQEIVAGLDWGYAPDPFACLILGRTKRKEWWVLDEYVENRLSPSDIARDVSGLCRQWGVKRVWADPSRPDMITEVRRSGVPVLPSRLCKPVRLGCARVNGLFKEGRLSIAPSCRVTISELGLYAFKRVPGTDRAKEGEPEDKFNHTMDAMRYVLWSMESPTREPWEGRPPADAWKYFDNDLAEERREQASGFRRTSGGY